MSEKCNDCGKHYLAVYRVPNEIWAQIAPEPEALGPHEEHQYGGLLCIDCADTRARERGISLYFDASVGDWRDNLEERK